MTTEVPNNTNNLPLMIPKRNKMRLLTTKAPNNTKEETQRNY